MESFLREIGDPSGAVSARIAWIRELSDVGMVNDPSKFRHCSHQLPKPSRSDIWSLR